MSNTKYTVLITGANRGLGLEFVKQYAMDDYQVIACSRKINKKDALHRLQTSFANIYGNMATCKCFPYIPYIRRVHLHYIHL